MGTLKAVVLGAGCIAVFALSVAGYYNAIVEAGGIQLARHALDFCPNWLLGFVTGAAAIGLAWWAWPKRS